MLLRDYKLFGTAEGLDEAILTIGQVVTSTPEYHPDFAKYVSSLALAFCSRFELTASMDDLN